ncbi:hypothetical protein CAOG_009419 [Capsaspora owczarzaki ATCC 30864]|uniref:Uncharacterized protein n=1 Tax=Capsaspora owczarzaki (strain ATCC 30864) TaxID=595528 RepID=A0A0D2WJ15_CAPO3|nr:hypothetical protein CAOG_009419 [Capsaspora owczarzaki ATCC 30864]
MKCIDCTVLTPLVPLKKTKRNVLSWYKNSQWYTHTSGCVVHNNDKKTKSTSGRGCKLHHVETALVLGNADNAILVRAGKVDRHGASNRVGAHVAACDSKNTARLFPFDRSTKSHTAAGLAVLENFLKELDSVRVLAVGNGKLARGRHKECKQWLGMFQDGWERRNWRSVPAFVGASLVLLLVARDDLQLGDLCCRKGLSCLLLVLVLDSNRALTQPPSLVSRSSQGRTGVAASARHVSGRKAARIQEQRRVLVRAVTAVANAVVHTRRGNEHFVLHAVEFAVRARGRARLIASVGAIAKLVVDGCLWQLPVAGGGFQAGKRGASRVDGQQVRLHAPLTAAKLVSGHLWLQHVVHFVAIFVGMLGRLLLCDRQFRVGLQVALLGFAQEIWLEMALALSSQLLDVLLGKSISSAKLCPAFLWRVVVCNVVDIVVVVVVVQSVLASTSSTTTITTEISFLIFHGLLSDAVVVETAALHLCPARHASSGDVNRRTVQTRVLRPVECWYSIVVQVVWISLYRRFLWKVALVVVITADRTCDWQSPVLVWRQLDSSLQVRFDLTEHPVQSDNAHERQHA